MAYVSKDECPHLDSARAPFHSTNIYPQPSPPRAISEAHTGQLRPRCTVSPVSILIVNPCSRRMNSQHQVDLGVADRGDSHRVPHDCGDPTTNQGLTPLPGLRYPAQQHRACQECITLPQPTRGCAAQHLRELPGIGLMTLCFPLAHPFTAPQCLVWCSSHMLRNIDIDIEYLYTCSASLSQVDSEWLPGTR